MLKDLEQMRTHLNAQGDAAVSIENAALQTVEDHKAFVAWAETAREQMTEKISEVMFVIGEHGKQLDQNFASLIDKSIQVIDSLEGNKTADAPQTQGGGDAKLVVGTTGGWGQNVTHVAHIGE